VHTIIEEKIGGRKPRVHPEYKGYLKGFDEYVEQFEPEWLFNEETVRAGEYGCAEWFDAIAKVKVAGSDERGTVVVDFKTTKSGVHADVALQLNA